MSDTFFVQVEPLKYLANQIDAQQAALTQHVAAFKVGSAIMATTNDALPTKDIRAQYGQEVDNLERLLEEITQGLHNWAAALRAAATNYAAADAQASGALSQTGTNI